jgi:hypothetical protein
MKRYTYTYADLDATTFKKSFPIPAGTLVLGVLHRVTTVFAGGTPALTIGDSVTADLWASLNTTNPDDINPTALNNVFLSVAKGGIQAKYYALTDRLIVTGVTGLTAGAGEIFVLISGKED